MHDDQQDLIDLLRPMISSDRLGTYLTAAGFNHSRALNLYIWNAHLGEAFHPCIQATEVALRNQVNNALKATFGDDWWKSEDFLKLADRQRKIDLDQAKTRIQRRGTDLCTPQLVATLSLGFWVGMLSPRYNPALWSRSLRKAFPHLPADGDRQLVHSTARKVADLRNRISHHEPIFRQNITAEYSNIMSLLKWMSPHKATWVKSHIRTASVMRAKP